MQYRVLGKSDLRVSVLSLGTWLTVGETLSRQRLAEIIAAAAECGINTIDTADSYGFGETERALGEILKSCPRSQFLIFTKCYFSTDPSRSDPFGLSAQTIVRSAEACLRRLRVDCIDLLQCHRPDPHVPVEETTQAMERLVQEGKIRWWGVSKWSNAAIEQAFAAGGAHLVSRQELYNLFHREPERDHFAFCREHGLAFLAYSPLARGMLTGKYLYGVPDDSRAANPQHKATVYDLAPDKLARVKNLQDLAAQQGYDAGPLALATYLKEPVVASAIIGVTNPKQIRRNVTAVDIDLSDEVDKRIRSLF